MSTGPAAPGPDGDPDFGPGGYLPDRAARRARKIVLRAPLGLQWLFAAILAGVVVLIAGIIFLRDAGGPPGAPFIELGEVATLVDGPIGEPAPDGAIEFLSTQSGRLRVLHVRQPPISWCEASRQFEGPAGIWSATGRGLGGAESLPEHPTTIVDGIAYWDPSATAPGPLANPTAATHGC